VDDLRALAGGSRDAIDPARGVVFVVYATDASGEDPRADAQGMIRTASRACGAELDDALEHLGADIARRLEDEAWSDLVRCEGSTCSIPAMGEYDLTGALTFEDGALVSVVRIEGGPVTDELVAAGEAYAEAQLAELAGGRCSG